MKYIALTILLFVSFEIYSQNNNYYRLYAGIDFGVGTSTDGYIDLNLITKSDYIYSLFFLTQFKKSTSVPNDFDPGVTVFGDGIPKIKMNTFGVSFGKVFNSEYNYINTSLKGGILFGNIEEPCNFTKKYKPHPWYDLSSNYEYELKKGSLYGLLINYNIEFMFSKFFGLRTSLYSNINLKQPTFGIKFGIIFGLLKK